MVRRKDGRGKRTGGRGGKKRKKKTFWRRPDGWIPFGDLPSVPPSSAVIQPIRLAAGSAAAARSAPRGTARIRPVSFSTASPQESENVAEDAATSASAEVCVGPLSADAPLGDRVWPGGADASAVADRRAAAAAGPLSADAPLGGRVWPGGAAAAAAAASAVAGRRAVAAVAGEPAALEANSYSRYMLPRAVPELENVAEDAATSASARVCVGPPSAEAPLGDCVWSGDAAASAVAGQRAAGAAGPLSADVPVGDCVWPGGAAASAVAGRRAASAVAGEPAASETKLHSRYMLPRAVPGSESVTGDAAISAAAEVSAGSHTDVRCTAHIRLAAGLAEAEQPHPHYMLSRADPESGIITTTSAPAGVSVGSLPAGVPLGARAGPGGDAVSAIAGGPAASAAVAGRPSADADAGSLDSSLTSSLDTGNGRHSRHHQHTHYHTHYHQYTPQCANRGGNAGVGGARSECERVAEGDAEIYDSRAKSRELSDLSEPVAGAGAGTDSLAGEHHEHTHYHTHNHHTHNHHHRFVAENQDDKDEGDTESDEDDLGDLSAVRKTSLRPSTLLSSASSSTASSSTAASSASSGSLPPVSLPPCTFEGGYLFSIEPVATEKVADTRAWINNGADFEAFFCARRAQRLHVIDLGTLVASEEAAAFTYIIDEAWRRPHWSGKAAEYRKLVDLCRKFDHVPVVHVCANRVDLATLGLNATDVGDFQRTVDADCRSASRRDRGPDSKRLNFYSSCGYSSVSAIKGLDGEPTVTGDGMGGKAVFATKAMLAAERLGNQTFASLGMKPRGGGRFGIGISGETDPSTGVAWECAPIGEAKAGLLTYGTPLPNETPGTEPRGVGVHLDAGNDHGPLSHQTFGLSFLGRCDSTRREYRVVGALYMRKCVGHWMERSYSATPPTPTQLEYRGALVASMIEVASMRWPLRQVATLELVTLEHQRTRSLWDHTSANYGGLCCGDYQTWPHRHDVSLVVSHLIGACGINDAAICLGRHFPKYGSAELYQVEGGTEATVAARLLIGALSALSSREKGGEPPQWSQPRPAVRGSERDFCRWTANQALLQKTCEMVLRTRVCDPMCDLARDSAPQDERWEVATKEEALDSATGILNHLRCARDLLLDFNDPRCIAAQQMCYQKGCFKALELVHAQPYSNDEDTANADVLRTQMKALSPSLHYRFARLVFPQGVDSVELSALHDEIDERRRFVQLRAACCELGQVAGVDPTNGVVLFGIMAAFVTTHSVRPSPAMLDAILRGAWVPADPGTKDKMRKAGLRYSETRQIGRTPLELALRTELPSCVITTSDAEGEFENWPREGDRNLSMAASGSRRVHKWCSAPGFPAMHVQEMEGGLLGIVKRSRYSAYGSGSAAAIYARWEEASPARRVNPWPQSWAPVWIEENEKKKNVAKRKMAWIEEEKKKKSAAKRKMMTERG